MTPPRVVGLAGKAKSGKDTVADRLVLRHDYVKCYFADPLKQMVIRALQACPPPPDVRRLLGGGEYFPDWDALVWREKPPFIRWLLQFVGTNVIRNEVNGAYWVRCAEGMVDRLLAEGRRVVLADARFPNEVMLVRKLGGECWRVIRTDLPPLEGTAGLHPSEVALDGFEFDRVLEAPTGVHHLHRLVDRIMGGGDGGPDGGTPA